MNSDFIQYHSKEKMGYWPSPEQGFHILTKRLPKGFVNNRIWLIAGKGKPKSYFLVSYFIAEGSRASSHPEFRFEVYGSIGKWITPLNLTYLAWFADLQNHQANFGRGFNAIEPRFVAKLEELAASSPEN